MLTRNAAAGRPSDSAATAHAMHPVVVEVPWPELGIAVWPMLALLAAWGGFLAFHGVRRRERFVTVLGAVLAVLGLVAAFTARGARLLTGPLEVRAWGALFAVSLALGGIAIVWRGAARGIESNVTLRACVTAALGAIVGARVGWALVHPATTESLDGVVAFYRGGLSVWGGLAGALAGAFVSTRRTGAPLGELLDLAAPGFGAGVALTRLGCYLEGCDFGVPLSKGAPHLLATLGTFPKDSPAWTLHVLSRGLSSSASASLPVHPVELYEALGGVALVAAAFVLTRRKLRPGFAFGGVLFGYLVLRVSLDSLRDDPVEMWVSRALLLLVLLGGASYAFWQRQKAQKTRGRPIHSRQK